VATIVCLHAHPDDEALQTRGTITKLSAEGHRVVLVVATDGINGPADSVSQHPSRLDELRASAGVLGTGQGGAPGLRRQRPRPALFDDPPDRQRFARADAIEAAGLLAEILRDEHADVLLSSPVYRHFARMPVTSLSESPLLRSPNPCQVILAWLAVTPGANGHVLD